MTSGIDKTKEAIQTSTIVTFIGFRSHVIGKVNLLNLRDLVLLPPCVICLARLFANATARALSTLKAVKSPTLAYKFCFKMQRLNLQVKFENFQENEYL